MEPHDIILGGAFLLNKSIVYIVLAITIFRLLRQLRILLLPRQPQIPLQPQNPRLRGDLGDDRCPIFIIWLQIRSNFLVILMTLDVCKLLDRELEIGDQPQGANQLLFCFGLAFLVKFIVNDTSDA